MTAKTKKVALYTLAGVLFSSLAIAALYFLVLGAATVWNKKQLASGSLRIIATVTEVDDSFHFVRGGEGAHSISYTFTYRDSTGKTQKATRSDFELANGDDHEYKVGTQIVISYLVANADINEPTRSLGKMSASFVFMSRVISGFVTLVTVYLVLWRRFPRVLMYKQGNVRVLVLLGVSLASFAVGAALGGYFVLFLENILF